MTSQILIDDMEFFAFHGYYPEEQNIGCKYTVSLVIDTPLDLPGQTDCLDDTINYENIYTIVRKTMDTPSKLIEYVAARIIESITAHYPQITHIKVTLYKYNPPLGGQVRRVGICLEK